MPALVLTTAATAVTFTGGGQKLKFHGNERRMLQKFLHCIEQSEGADTKRASAGVGSRLADLPIFPTADTDLVQAKEQVKTRLIELLAM